MKLLSFEQRFVAHRIIVVLPQCLHTVPDVAVLPCKFRARKSCLKGQQSLRILT